MKFTFIRLTLICTSLLLLACQSEVETQAHDTNVRNHDAAKASSEEASSLKRIEKKPSSTIGKWKSEEARQLSFAGVNDPQELKKFLSDIRHLAKNDDREGIAKLIFYPFHTYEAKGGIIKNTYQSESEFLRDYDMIVTSSVQMNLENVSYDDFFSNWRGGAVARGAIWFNTFEGELKIIKLSG